jgi:antitoxin PrlF
MIKTKLMGNGQTTIPRPVRAALHLRKGDELAYAMEDQRVIPTKARPASFANPFGCFTEWDSNTDRNAYSKL